MSAEEGSRRQRPEALWKEDDVLDGSKVRAMVLILRTSGCWWSRKKGCLMCGYNLASDREITSEDIQAQIASAKERYEGEPMLKVYTSGSFLDRNEVPLDARAALFDAFPEARSILFESRPEFVTADELESLPRARTKVALGLESADDEVLRLCIRKGFKVSDYQKAAETLRSAGIGVRTYLLLKPPFMTESQAMRDTIASVGFAAPYSESISINPLNVQKDTLVEKLWRRGDYRPPWFWTLLEVLRLAKEMTDIRVFSSPSGAGTPRGIHNCPQCDQHAIEAIRRFSFSQDLSDLKVPECDCHDRWLADIRLAGTMRTSVDVERYLADDLLFQ